MLSDRESLEPHYISLWVEGSSGGALYLQVPLAAKSTRLESPAVIMRLRLYNEGGNSIAGQLRWIRLKFENVET